MANVVQHCLSAKNLKNLLHNAGVVSVKMLHGRRNRMIQLLVIDMKKCCASEWQKVEDEAGVAGVLDFSKKNAEGQYGVRRDLTKTEIEELPYWPIVLASDDTIEWNCCWKANNDPAFFISKLFPEIEFHLENYYEGTRDGCYQIKDGVFTETDEYRNNICSLKYVEKE